MAVDRYLAQAVALVGAAAVRWRRGRGGLPAEAAIGPTPHIPPGRPQGAVPTLKMPTARGWEAGQVPQAAAGLRVQAFASGLDHPRWLQVLPGGDVCVAEANQVPAGKPRRLFDHAMRATMRRAKALGTSADRITLWRDADGDGVAEQRHVLLERRNGLRQPFGMALVGDRFYVGNTDGVVAFPYQPGQTRIDASAEPLLAFPPGGHWTRSLLPSADGRQLYIGVGSLSNIADFGMAAEEGRAAVWQLDLATRQARIFASGLRNPVGLAWEPVAGRLWTVVNERDGLGDETPPDYLSAVAEGGFYGWPYCYWGRTVDDRVPQASPEARALVARALQPDYALGGHTASLGLCWMPAGTLPGFDQGGMVIGQHGSWNRAVLSGYKVVFVPFANGRPAGPPRDILWGFLAPDESVSYGRPVGVAIGPGGRSLLVADDVGNVVWRVAAG